MRIGCSGGAIAAINHALNVKNFFHKDLKGTKVKLLLTGSDEDEMFPKNHYKILFGEKRT